MLYARSVFGSRFTKKIEEVKSQAVEKSMYLYLVDEYSGAPVYDSSGVYPVKIDVASDLVGKYMPMMRIGLQAASVANGAAALANVFCPFVLSTLVPKSFMSNAKSLVDDLDKPSNVGEFGSVQKEVDNGGEGGTAKRGSELRDFEKFLLKHDEDQLYAGLRRACDEAAGTAIWVSEASAKKIEMDG